MQQDPIDFAAFAIIILTFVGVIGGSFLAIRDGRRLPPMSRSTYRRKVPLLFFTPLAVILLCVPLILVPTLQALFPLPILLMPVIHYHIMRSGVQRLSDIEGRTYQGFWRAFFSYRPEMIFYLCSKQGQTPTVDINVF
ncbi:MAG TPA: hypothetical protein VM659_14295 [Dongiaceae bacterium]|nr:hypothetical protein [Dongiaceae bacterium]